VPGEARAGPVEDLRAARGELLGADPGHRARIAAGRAGPAGRAGVAEQPDLLPASLRRAA
jgi:hypothetical protein